MKEIRHQGGSPIKPETLDRKHAEREKATRKPTSDLDKIDRKYQNHPERQGYKQK